MTKIFFVGIILICSVNLMAQCPTSGTISSNCTTTGNMTINGSMLTVNPGVVVTVTGTLTIKAAGTLNGTGATFNLGGLAETNGSPNIINGGTYNTGSFSTGGGGSLTIEGVTVAISPNGNVGISGSAIEINNSSFTGVNNWSTNVSSLEMTGTSVIAAGSIQLEDATVNGGTFTTGTSFSTTNGTSTISGADIDVGTAASIRNTAISNSTLDVAGLLGIASGDVSFNNSTINSGTGNAGLNDTDALWMNGGGSLTLTGNTQMNVRGSVTNNEWYIDNSDVIVTGDFDNAGNEILDVYNNGTINIQGDFNNSGNGNVDVGSGGLVDVDGDFNNTGSGDVDVDGGTFAVGGVFTGQDPTGDGGDCSAGGGGCCGVGCGSLPITLIDFQSVLNGSTVFLTWTTASELNNDYFTIEESLDGINFNAVAKVSGNGTTQSVSHYSFQDEIDFSTNSYKYYRLSQTDYDGTHVKLKVNVIPLNLGNIEISIFPNPVLLGDEIKVHGIPAHTPWRLFSTTGKEIAAGEILSDNTIELPEVLAGAYMISFPSNIQMIVIK